MAVLTLSAAEAEIKANPYKFYVYVLSRPTGEPFYVGVGNKRRIRAHEKNACERWRGHKYSIIRKILKDGLCVGYSLTFFNERDAAVEEEIRLISFLGRENIGTGPLTNLTAGGEGIVGIAWRFTAARAEGAKRAGEKLRGRKASAETIAKLSTFRKGRKQSAAHVANRAAALRGKKRTAAQIEKMALVRRGSKMPPRTRAALARWRLENPGALSKAQKIAWQSPELRARMSKKLTGRKMPAGYSERHSIMQKAKFEDPVFRAKWEKAKRAGMDTPTARENMSRASLKNWSDPVYREKMAASRAAASDRKRAAS